MTLLACFAIMDYCKNLSCLIKIKATNVFHCKLHISVHYQKNDKLPKSFPPYLFSFSAFSSPRQKHPYMCFLCVLSIY